MVPPHRLATPRRTTIWSKVLDFLMGATSPRDCWFTILGLSKVNQRTSHGSFIRFIYYCIVIHVVVGNTLFREFQVAVEDMFDESAKYDQNCFLKHWTDGFHHNGTKLLKLRQAKKKTKKNIFSTCHKLDTNVVVFLICHIRVRFCSNLLP